MGKSERIINILDINYKNPNIEKVTTKTTQLITEEKLLLGLLNEFEDLFDGTLGKWYTETIYLKISPDYKTFNYH